MATLKETELSAAYSRPVEPLTLPFRPIRRLVAAATDILRRKGNVFIVGGLDHEKLSPTLTDNKGKELPNPNFNPAECFKITRPTAEIIVLLTCEESTLIACMGDPDLLDTEVNRILITASDTEILAQIPAVFTALESIGASTVAVDSEDSETLNPEKKTPPAPIGSPHG